MTIGALILFFAVSLPGRDQPLQPARSPDLQILATTQVPQAFATPAGGNYSLFFNGELVYPRVRKHRWFSGYSSWHTFLSELVWSPDSHRLALVEETYDWEYVDPYNRDFEGSVTDEHLYLTVVSREGNAACYVLDHVSLAFDLRWLQNDKLVLNGRTFDLQANPPRVIR